MPHLIITISSHQDTLVLVSVCRYTPASFALSTPSLDWEFLMLSTIRRAVWGWNSTYLAFVIVPSHTWS